MTASIYPCPFVHLSVDIDATNLHGLPANTVQKIVKDNYAFGQALRLYGVPTIHVTFPRANTTFLHLPAQQRWSPLQPHRSATESRKLSAFGLHNVQVDEDVFVKGTADAFENGLLHDIITKQFGAVGIIVTGGTTTICIPATLRGAVRCGFRPYAVFDRLFTTLDWQQEAEKHLEFLSLHLLEQPGNIAKTIRVVSADHVLSFFQDALSDDASTEKLPQPRQRKTGAVVKQHRSLIPAG